MARQKGPFDAVQFTRESAERIASVVRAAEVTPSSASPLTFDKRFPERIPKQVRAATFSGSWAIGSAKNVTFKYAPTATADVVNLSWPITITSSYNEDCLVGREGTNWWLVVPVLEATSLSVITSLSIAATLNTTSCQISVSKTAGTTSITFLRIRGT